MPMSRGAFPVIVARAGLKRAYFLEYMQHKLLYPTVFNMHDSTRGYEDFVKVSGLGRMAQMGEGESIFYDRAVEGSRISAGHAMFGLGFQVSRVLMDDEQYGIMTRMSQALARSVQHEQEVRAWEVFNDAQAGSTFTGFDSKALLHNSHTLLNSTSTQDNRIQADLSVSALEAAVDLFATVVDESNLNIAINPRILVIPAQNRWLASTLVDSEFDPESANNAINPIRDVGLSWFATPFITDTDSWFILADKGEHDLGFYWRLKPETDDTTDFDTKTLKFSSIMRLLIHWNDFRGVVGSMGV